MSYQQDKELLKIFSGKRVAVIGPSPHLLNKGIGEIIDSYDIVCRINEIHPTGYEADYGKKTDIIFHNCSLPSIEEFGERLVEKSIISKYIKFVVCPCVKSEGQDNWTSWDNDFISPVVDNFAKINIFNIPFKWIGMENYRTVYNLFGSEPNAGQTSILMILNHNIKELFISGFSFYEQGNTDSLAYLPNHIYKHKINKLVGEAGHPQKPQKECFKKYIFEKYNDLLKVDSYLNELLSLNHKNVLDLE